VYFEETSNLKFPRDFSRRQVRTHEMSNKKRDKISQSFNREMREVRGDRLNEEMDKREPRI
jgi:hypothetical protein